MNARGFTAALDKTKYLVKVPIFWCRMNDQATFVNKRVVATRIGVSADTCKVLRLSGQWLENIYWVRLSPRKVVYNVELCSHWAATRGNPQLEAIHQLKVQEYLQKLEVPTKRGRKLQGSYTSSAEEG